jgi:hypothetical protein
MPARMHARDVEAMVGHLEPHVELRSAHAIETYDR